MKFDSSLFPKYSELTSFERHFLRTCCYFPPRPSRVPSAENLTDISKFQRIFENAFSPDIWTIVRGKHVLDFGCGEGGYVLALAINGAALATGIDIQDKFQNATLVAKTKHISNLAYISGDSTSISNDSFDVVISHDSFEHFEFPEKILKEMVRITKPGGFILIKFGPPWKNPWGRHMSGTIRKDRPWIHLLVSERTLMRVHSVYHNEPILKESFNQLPGGLNKMTIKRLKKIISKQKEIQISKFESIPIKNNTFFQMPMLREYFSSGVRMIIIKKE